MGSIKNKYKMIPVYKPYLNDKNLKYAHEALDSTWISSKGDYIQNVESQLARIHQVSDARMKCALTCCNGTAATHLVAKLLKYKHPKIKKIIVPNNVYVAAWNSLLFDSAFELQAVDADVDTWNWNNDLVKELWNKSDPETTALMVVHNIGNIVNVPMLYRKLKGAIIIEDNCEGFLGMYEEKPSGSESLASSISFFGNKTLTSGEGGAVIADNTDLGFLYNLRSQGQSSQRFIHSNLGYNYRMTNIEAAILYGQMQDKYIILQNKKNIFKLYKELLSDIEEISWQKEEHNTEHSKWMFGVRIKDNKSYDDVESYFKRNYIEVRPMFYPIDRHAHLKHISSFGGTSIAEQLNNECVILPSYPDLKDYEICHIVNTLKQYLVK